MNPDPTGQNPRPERAKVQEEPSPLLDILKDKAPEVLKGISEKSRNKLSQITIERQRVVRFGPLPAPDDLAAYNAIVPNGADRIMKMAENQSAHRIKLEDHVIRSQQGAVTRGQFFGFIIGLVGLCLAAYVGISGQPVLGGTLGSATLVSLVWAFVTGKQEQAKNLADKRPAK